MVKVNNFFKYLFLQTVLPHSPEFHPSIQLINLNHIGTALYATAGHNKKVVKYAPCRIVQRREVFLIQVVDVLRQLLLDFLGKTLDHGDLAISGKLRWGKVEQGYYYVFTRLSAWK